MKGHDARAGEGSGRAGRVKAGSERGFSLMEAIVATVIATIAVMGLAYSFGNARGLVNRYEAARVALAAAQRRMELLAVMPAGADSLQVNRTFERDVFVDGAIVVHEAWTVTPYTDPAGGPGLKRVVVTVTWGGATAAETIRLARLFPPR
jgi:Tfp pilus assembly protein PilV